MSSNSIAGRIANIEKELEAVKRRLSSNRKRFRSAAGSWSDFDAEEFKDSGK